MTAFSGATVCPCGYEISEDEEREYIDGEARCTACAPHPGYTTITPFRSHT
ncbi:hypothetical protein ACFYN0_26800 [Streptomyces sp. NPDC006704]|uniref:hypothetical protein n=1 Tax=Streptomyces sp. NPDC006704 TaxID=3364760 RepID=UPI0036D00FBE